MIQFNLRPVALAIAAGLAFATSGASAQTPATNGAAPAPAAVPAAALKPFKDVIKEAKEIPGYFTLWQKDDKVWIEIKPDQFDKPFFFANNFTTAIGEKAVTTARRMGRSHMAVFEKTGNQVQLIAKNRFFAADPGTPLAGAVAQGFSDSLIGSVAVASQPHPDRKSVLIEANPLLLTDIPMAATTLERTYRQAYAFDARNSSIEHTRNTPDQTSFNVRAHYALAKLAIPPLTAPGAPTPPQAPLPATLEDVRSLFLGYHYSFTPLPDQPMSPRLADDRVGHFVTRKYNFSNDRAPFPRVNYVNRWRLEKKDPAAAVSEPKQQIVYWLDKNIPVKYREAVRAGVLEWNKAFERVGFKNAIRVEQQSDSADFDTADTRHASIRWVVDINEGALAVGPSQVDPRSGEILDADISIGEGWARLPRRTAAESYPSRAPAAHAHEHDVAICNYGDAKLDEISFAMDLLEARGDIDPDSPEAESIVLATLKDVVTHEVGHTLGLRHNFKASTIYEQAKLDDSEFTKKHGLGGSVMDYNATNLALTKDKQGEYVMSTLGPYDYWAIEYAYKPLDAAKETEELKSIAARSTEPLLAFATDDSVIDGIDPTANQRDLGSDPLAYAERRIALVRELWQRLQSKQLKPGESYSVLRRNLDRGFSQMQQAAEFAAKFVGGVEIHRDHAGSHRANLNPIPADKQRAALKLVSTQLLSADSFRFKQEFLARLPIDFLNRDDALFRGDPAPSPEYSLSRNVFNVQKAVLDHAYSDTVAARMLDNGGKANGSKGPKPLALSELYDTLQASVWSELKSGSEIDLIRRDLQREHLKRMVITLTRPAPTTPADAKSLQRENARELLAHINGALKKTGLSKETRAHLAEAASTLQEALKANFTRASV